MAISWSDVQQWNPANLNTAVQNLTSSRQTLTTEADNAVSAKGRVQSSGAAVTAMLGSLGSLNGSLDRVVNDVSELMMATADASDGVWDVQTKVAECTSFVEQYPYLSIGEDGTVNCEEEQATTMEQAAPNGPGQTATRNADRQKNAQELRDLIKAAIDRAVEVDNDYLKRLNALANGTYVCAETAASDSQGLPDLPQAGWSATEVSVWWNALTEAERRKLIEKHPDAIRNLDGLPGGARDEANRSVLERETTAAENHQKSVQEKYDAEQKKIDAAHKWAVLTNSGNSAGVLIKPPNPFEEELQQANRRVADLAKLNELAGVMEEDGSGGYATGADGKPRHHYQLLTLDVPEGYDKDVKAAVAVGDVDKASNVATMVPGIGNTARNGMDGMLNNAEALRTAAGADKTAVVAWIGYDTPPGFLDSDSNGSQTDYMTPARADEAAPALNSFEEGLHASHQRQGVDPNLTVHAHSYGSLTAGTALMDTKTGVVDAAQLHGSPGARATDAHQWNVPYGHMYASANGHDYVAGIGPDNAFGNDFGPDPRYVPGVGKIASTPNGGHSDYWNNPEFMEDAAQITAGEDPSVNRADNAAAASVNARHSGQHH